MNINTKEGMSQAIGWTTEYIKQIKDGGVWIVPRSGTVVWIYHSAKRVSIYEGHRPDTSIAKVFKAMGWDVQETPHVDGGVPV